MATDFVDGSSMKETIICCRRIFKNISHRVSQSKSNRCMHNHFKSPNEYILSLIEFVEWCKTLASSPDPMDVSKAFTEFAAKKWRWASRCPFSFNNAITCCQQCSGIMATALHRALSSFSLALDPNRSILMHVLLWLMVWLQCLGVSSFYINVGRYFYRNTGILQLLYQRVHFLSEILHIFLKESKTWTMNKNAARVIDAVNVFLMSVVANIHRLDKCQWQRINANSADVICDHLIIMRNLCLHWAVALHCDVAKKIEQAMHALFIMLVFVLKRLEFNVNSIGCIREEIIISDALKLLISDVVDVEEALCNLAELIGTPLGRIKYLVKYIQSILVLFDRRETVNYHAVYRKIKRYSDRCRMTMYEDSGCSNFRCKRESKKACKYTCSRCKVASYCNRRCQKYDWVRGDHKRLCKDLC